MYSGSLLSMFIVDLADQDTERVYGSQAVDLYLDRTPHPGIQCVETWGIGAAVFQPTKHS
jgi:hypothetical protein